MEDEIQNQIQNQIENINILEFKKNYLYQRK